MTLITFATIANAFRGGTYESRKLSPGERVDRYEVLSEIGEGGMSTVYAVTHVHLGGEFALKVIRERPGDRQAPERFLREAKALRLLRDSKAVVDVYDASVHNNLPYIVLEKLSGRLLRDELKEYGTLSVSRTLDLLEEIADVLILQERNSILHRDLKPGNIYVRAHDGSFCVFDYGLVGVDADERHPDRVPHIVNEETILLVAQGDGSEKVIIGTPRYMAPEQLRNERVGPEADLFALGLVAWEALTGRPVRTAPQDEIMAQPDRPVPSPREVIPELPVEMETILQGLTQIDVGRRYQSAKDLLVAVQDYKYEGRRPRAPTIGRVFVAIPFSDPFGPVFSAIEDACDDVNLAARRMDRLVMIDDIWGQVVQEIDTALVVVADFSSAQGSGAPNANVLTEAAHARALQTQFIVISQDDPSLLPFDWRHHQVLRYEADPEGLESLRAALVARLRYCLRGQ